MKSDFFEIDSAISREDWDEVKRLILAGVTDFAHPYDEDDIPLIYKIIEARQEDVAIFWLDHGFPHYLTTGGRYPSTILHWAAKYGMPRLIERMLETGVDINKDDRNFCSPLWYAASSGQLACVKVLLANGANPDGYEMAGAGFPSDTPLCEAADAEIAACLLDAGANPALGPYGDYWANGDVGKHFNMDREILSPLACAALEGRMDVVRLFKDRGVPLDSQALRFMALDDYAPYLFNALELIRLGANPEGAPLLVAARAGNAPFCRMLLQAGAKPAPEALAMAALSGNEDCVDLFLESGDMATAIRLAAKSGAESILEKLLPLRPDLASCALLGAIAGCRLKLAMEILEKGADPDFRDNDGRTPLMLLYGIDRRKDGFRFMQVDPNRYRGKWGGRSWWMPTERDFEEKEISDFNFHRPDNWNEIVHLIDDDVLAFAAELIEKGADIHARDNKSRTALWHACSRSWMKSISWLAGLGLAVNERDSEGTNSFDAGCLSGESFTIEPMVKAGAVVDARDSYGDTALLKSAREFHENPRTFSLSVIMTLLRFDADPDLENNAGESLRKMAEKDDNIKFALDMHEKL